MIKTSALLLFAATVALSASLGLGAPAQAAEEGRCIIAKQCHGPLPQICEKCSNGHEACAHWACVRHRCVVQVCGRAVRS